MSYYRNLSDGRQESMRQEIAGAQQLSQMLQMLDAQYNNGNAPKINLEMQGVISNDTNVKAGAQTKDSNK
jgi:hypothetical protein